MAVLTSTHNQCFEQKLWGGGGGGGLNSTEFFFSKPEKKSLFKA